MTRRLFCAAVLVTMSLLTLLATAAPPARPAASPAASPAPVVGDGLTRPCRRAQLAVRTSGVISTRPASEGDRIAAGQLIAELNSDVEQAALAISTLKSESDHELRAAELAERQSLVELGRVQDLASHNNATKWELEKAKVDADIAKIRTQYARYQRQQSAMELARDKAALAERRLVAPFAGVIAKVFKEAGEAASETTPIVELVQYDPLWVEVKLGEQHVSAVKIGQFAEVTIGAQTRRARVIMVDPQVDAASGMSRVRLELPNSDGTLKAGLLASARFGASD